MYLKRELTVFRAPTRSLPCFFKFNKSLASIVWELLLIFINALWASLDALYSIRAIVRLKSRWNLLLTSGGSKTKSIAVIYQHEIKNILKIRYIIKLLFAIAPKPAVFQCDVWGHVEFQSNETHNNWWSQFLSTTRGLPRFGVRYQLHFLVQWRIDYPIETAKDYDTEKIGFIKITYLQMA
jgi:hypothetical protein